MKTALILSGGGARGAYQAGVLRGVAEILPEKNKSPFKIISGVSAGAINGAKLACDIENFSNAVEKLNYLWSRISSDQVFKTDLLSMNKFSIGVLSGLTKSLDSLLDTAPLKDTLLKHCDFSKIKNNIDAGYLESLIITANSYTSGTAVSFVQTSTSNLTWKESRRVARLVNVEEHHVMASSSIPLLFPPIKIGQHYYGDGCVRNSTPCSPSIRMGADKLFVIGVRRQLNAPDETDLSDSSEKPPSFVRIINTLLNAVLLDTVEQDVHRIQRINQFAKQSPTPLRGAEFKHIPALCISPSQDIGKIARHHAHHLPRLIRMSLSTFGSLDEASEILSYLLFEPHFCKQLLEMGYHDALASRDEILDFFQDA